MIFDPPDPNVVDWRWIAAAADLAMQHDVDSFTLSRFRIGHPDVCITIDRVTYNFTYYIENGGQLAEDEI